MPLLQPKLSLKVAQRQILTPGLMQMISVLALNKLELREMINTEIVENPVLEELDESVPLLDDVAGKEADFDRSAQEIADQAAQQEKDPFDEIDFGSYFKDYLDPGFRTPDSFEAGERPSFENFLSRPDTLSDHLTWQLASLNLSPELREAAEYVIGNLDEAGYLVATEEELLAGLSGPLPVPDGTTVDGNGAAASQPHNGLAADAITAVVDGSGAAFHEAISHAVACTAGKADENPLRKLLSEAIRIVQSLDPAGVATSSLEECLLAQIAFARRDFSFRNRKEVASAQANGDVNHDRPQPEAKGIHRSLETFTLAALIVEHYLPMLQKRDLRELSRVTRQPCEVVQQAIDFIRTLDPRPGQRYNRSEPRLIEPDVAFVKRDDGFVVVMNDEGLPVLRLNRGYRKLLNEDGAGREAREYVKERYRSALQLMRNIEQRKNTILRTCEAIVRRQTEFLEHGVEALKPMMIKEVAEEIGVHPSTVSRAVSSKYVHTPQGVFELRFFFSEGANGPEGGSTPLMLLKRKVKKIIEEEDPRKPLTDDLIAGKLGDQGIVVTRRTVAKYREDMGIPSTHQRRVRDGR